MGPDRSAARISTLWMKSPIDPHVTPHKEKTKVGNRGPCPLVPPNFCVFSLVGPRPLFPSHESTLVTQRLWTGPEARVFE
jgi:hypothetical protein